MQLTRAVLLLTAIGFAVFISKEAVADKCGFAQYRVLGAISTPPGVDKTQIRIVLFLEDQTRASDYPPPEGGDDFAHLSEDGSFIVTSFLSTASRGGRCRRVAPKGDLVITGNGIRSLRQKVIFEDLRHIRRKYKTQIQIEPIVLE